MSPNRQAPGRICQKHAGGCSATFRDDHPVIQAEFPLIRFHELRHSHASLLHAAETDLKTISERLGHASIGITADVYTHLLAKPQQDAAARIDGLLGHGNAGA